jgi:serine/threonine protein kinase
MVWNIRGPFQLIKEPTKHYVIQMNNTGKSEINIPKNITNKRQAAAWLRAHPANVARARFKPKGKPRGRVPAPFYMSVFAPPAKMPSPVKPIMTGPRTGYFQYQPGGQVFPFGSPQYPSPPKTGANRFTCSAGKSMMPIGKGRQGIIYKGNDFVAKVCPRDLLAATRGERQPAIIEFEIQKEVYNSAPDGVVEVYKHDKCIDFIPPVAMNMANVQNASKYDKSKQSIIFMEYCSGGSLTKWLDSKKQTDASMHHVITSVLKTLNKIKIKFPDFRHNDLHMENVFVSDRGFLIGDFGWARLKKTGTNPAVNTANKSGTAGAWGIGPNTDARYDAHCFLNNLRTWVSRKGVAPKAMAFLNEAIPAGYRGATDTHVKEWRLKYEDPCPGLPTVQELLKNKFITGQKFSSPNLLAAKGRLRRVILPGRMKRVRSVNLLSAKARLRKMTVSRPRILSANIRAARNALKPLGPRGRVTSAQIRSARAHLRGRVHTKRKMTGAMMKNKRFDKIIEYYWDLNGRKSGKNYEEAWALARTKATRLVERRLNSGNAPFTPVKGDSVRRSSAKRLDISVLAQRAPSPPKLNAAKLANAAARLKAKSNALKAARAKIVVLNKKTRKNANFEQSPSGRIKVKNPQTGRFVYANGPTISLSYLKNLATRRGVNIKGIRAKDAIARKIFG